MGRKNEARSLETDVSPERAPGKHRTADPAPKPADYDVLVVGGGPAGLAAAACCGRKLLRTGVFESDSWGGILTRWCPDKRIDNYPGLRPGILARELARFLIEDAKSADVDLIEGRVEEIAPGRKVVAGSMIAKGRILILANGNTAAEAGILGEREFAGRGGGLHYLVRDPAAFRGKRVVVVGGGGTAISFVQRLSGIAARITLVHRQSAFRFPGDLPEELDRNRGIRLLRNSTVEEILGSRFVEGVRIREHATGKTVDLPADAVIMAVGRRPNTAIFRDLDLTLDPGGQIRTDLWQRTSVPGVLAVGDVSSHLKMIVTAVAQAATAAHQAYLDIRNPYWK
jgi:thioredoxin reductase (NADPH)